MQGNLMEFIQARNYGPRLASRKIDIIVIHTMENDEKPDGAENVARWFAGTTAPRASAHYCIDNNSIVQCVRDQDVAWHAPGANHNGLGFEHAGRASQADSLWNDAYSKAELGLSATLAARKCKQYNIPAVWLDIADVKAGKRGITSHNNVSKAFGLSSHWDPGPNFPAGRYVARVQQILTPPKVRFELWALVRKGDKWVPALLDKSEAVPLDRAAVRATAFYTRVGPRYVRLLVARRRPNIRRVQV
jgi:N-acetyl-anhydromuramyl-L-alanine amidase AmpD